MDISTFNTVLASGIGILSICFGVVLGAILSSVRDTKRSIRHIEDMVIRHDTKIEQLEKQIPDIYDKIYKLNHV